jgi:hypothetical protein
MPVRPYERWALHPLDPGVNDGRAIVGQLAPEDMVEIAEVGVYADAIIPGRRHPRTQWVYGGPQSLSFKATFIEDASVKADLPDPDNRFLSVTGAPEAAGVVSQFRDTLKSAVAPDRTLKRPPRWLFVWGELGFECFVESVGSITYDRLADDDGRLHTGVFEITLKIVEPEEADETTGGDDVVKEPELRAVADGDTFESIAAEEYGDPDLGVKLRQNSEKAFPEAGDLVEVPEEAILRRDPGNGAVVLDLARPEVVVSIEDLSDYLASPGSSL